MIFFPIYIPFEVLHLLQECRMDRIMDNDSERFGPQQIRSLIC